MVTRKIVKDPIVLLNLKTAELTNLYQINIQIEYVPVEKNVALQAATTCQVVVPAPAHQVVTTCQGVVQVHAHRVVITCLAVVLVHVHQVATTFQAAVPVTARQAVITCLVASR